MKYLELKRVNAPYEKEIRRAVDGVIASGWYLRGEVTRRFEEHYAEYIGTQYCVGCGNGLDALTLIFLAYKELGEMKEGDEVIVPANTYIASILAITRAGLTPVLVDADSCTMQIDDRLIEQALTPRTRAVMIVHLYGCCAYTERIGELCRRHSLKLIEDNAQAHGCNAYLKLLPEGKSFISQWGVHTADPTIRSVAAKLPSLQGGAGGRLQKTGSLGHAAAHSFYPGKNLGALGDAGAVTTNDGSLSEMIRAIGNYGSHVKYVHDYLGCNSRIDEIQAAVLDVKLSHLDSDNQRRKDIASRYIEKVRHPLIVMPQFDRDCVWHIFPVLCQHREQLQLYLKEHGVETQIHYPIPPHRQKCYPAWNTLSFPVTESLCNEELSLPCHQQMSDEEVDEVATLLGQFHL